MAEWLRRSLAEWKVPGSNLTMGKVSEKKKKKKKKKKPASYPLLAWWKSGWRECSPTRKKAGVCAIMSIWLVHIKEHVWTVGTCPTTILLSTVNMCECVWMAALKAVGKRGSVPLVDCGPVCSPGVDLGEGGSLSYWHDTVKYWPELHWLL